MPASAESRWELNPLFAYAVESPASDFALRGVNKFCDRSSIESWHGLRQDTR